MSESMPPSWRSLAAQAASSRISSFKGYLQVKQIGRPSWGAWAGQKVNLRRGNSDGLRPGIETVTLFPGWAVRRYLSKRGESEEAFAVDIFISGFAASQRTPETLSRSQRAFMRLAKGYASLPKLTANDALIPTSISTEDPLAQKRRSPRPGEMFNGYNMQELDRQFQRAHDISPLDDSRPSSPDSEEPPSPSPPSRPDILRQHTTLEARLHPFWSSALSTRIIRLYFFAQANISHTSDHEPVVIKEVTTAADGSFKLQFTIPWETFKAHPGAQHIVYSEQWEEHEMLVSAQLLPPSSSLSSVAMEPDHRQRDLPRRPQPRSPLAVPKTIHIPITNSPIRVISDIDDTVKLSSILSGARTVFYNVFVKDLKDNVIPGMGEWYTRMWTRGVRFHYVSNGPFELLPVINEFLHISQLPPGSIKLKSYAGRSIFNGLLSAPATRKRAGILDILDAFPESQFFLIGDSGEQDLELYAEFARERPNQILAIFIRDVELSGVPIDDPTGRRGPLTGGSLPSNGSGSAESGNLQQRHSSDPSNTRSGMFKLSSSPPPRTYGAGPSSGEYFTSSPVTTSEPEEIRGPATGAHSLPYTVRRNRSTTAPPTRSRFVRTAYPVHPSSTPSSPMLSNSNSPTSTRTSSLSLSGSSRILMSEGEKKRLALQTRVHGARSGIPGQVQLRVFRDPSECVEVDEILEKEERERLGKS